MITGGRTSSRILSHSSELKLAKRKISTHMEREVRTVRRTMSQRCLAQTCGETGEGSLEDGAVGGLRVRLVPALRLPGVKRPRRQDVGVEGRDARGPFREMPEQHNLKCGRTSTVSLYLLPPAPPSGIPPPHIHRPGHRSSNSA